MKRQPRPVGQRAPRGLRLHPHRAPPGRGGEGRVLVHPAARVIAVDAGRRQVARPFDMRRGLRDGLACGDQHRVARFGRRDRGEKVRRARQRRAQVRPGPDERLHALGAETPGLVRRPGRADHGPAFGDQPPGQRPRRVAVAEGEEGLRHAPDPRPSSHRTELRSRASGRVGRARHRALAAIRNPYTIHTLSICPHPAPGRAVKIAVPSGRCGRTPFPDRQPGLRFPRLP